MLKSILIAAFLLPVSWLPAQVSASPLARQGEIPKNYTPEKTSTPSEKVYSGHALKLSIGLAGVEGDSIPFTGPAGFSWRLAWQKSLDQKRRLRLSASLAMEDMIGSEFTLPNYRRRVQVSLRSTALQTGLHYDLFKWGGFSIVTAGNVALRYLRGMSIPESISNGSEITNLNEVYPTVGFSLAFRFDPRPGPLAYEFNLFSQAFGRDGSRFRQLSLGLIYKFKKLK